MRSSLEPVEVDVVSREPAATELVPMESCERLEKLLSLSPFTSLPVPGALPDRHTSSVGWEEVGQDSARVTDVKLLDVDNNGFDTRCRFFFRHVSCIGEHVFSNNGLKMEHIKCWL